MRKITDKLLIIAFCCVICERSTTEIAALLISASASALCQYTEKPKFSALVCTLYTALCIIFPPFVCAMPLILYDIYAGKHFPLFIPSAALYVCAAASQNLSSPAAVLMLCITALIMQYRTSSYENLYKNYIQSVDSSTESTRLLRENNLKLIENKNYEVRLATLNERNRIAREIHDNVGHMLSRSILQVQALRLINDDKLRSDGLADLGETLGSAMTSIRRSVHNLHDDSLDMDASIREAAAPLAAKGIAANCQCNCSDDIPNRIKVAVTAIVKEGVSNIIKHSSGDRAEITFREHPAFYQLKIEDNGKCTEISSGSGIGIANMRARIEELGGIINISSSEKGFRIFITIRKDEA